jgi:hypothetical protein
VSKKDKPKSRWNAGNERYSKAMEGDLKKYRESEGWRNGARVVRRSK